MSRDSIVVRGAREHNLKGFDVELPRDKLVVLTGLSGSGKSSLAFDTIYAEGQRRYVESLSAYARQFLGLMEKPDVDHIEGLSPAISIDQKSTSNNPRSTVGTVTEIYDYLRLLWARIGVPYCPECGRPIDRQTVQQIVDAILAYEPGSRLVLLAPVTRAKKGEHVAIFEEARRAGFVRVRIDGEIRDLDDEIALDKNKRHDIDVVVDRLVVPGDDAPEGATNRIAESVETALKLGSGVVHVARWNPDPGEDDSERVFSEHFACPYDGYSFGEIEPRTFSFNNPHGACQRCTGLGVERQVDPERIIADRTKSIVDGAIEPWSRSGGVSKWYLRLLEGVAAAYGFTVDQPFNTLTDEQQRVVLHGAGEERIPLTYTNDYGRTQEYRAKYEGIVPNLARRYQETDSEHVRNEVEKYMAAIPCPECKGERLRIEARHVRIDGRTITQVTSLSIAKTREWFEFLASGATPLSSRDQTIGRQVLKEILSRLEFLVDVGLDYLTVDRGAASLSGGEAQRIRLATQIGSALVGVLYICDEPSVGLHPTDGDRLIRTLERLRDIGNTVIVVEHDEAMMEAADWIVDLGPGAGIHGGHIVAQGTINAIKKSRDSITGAYLSGRRTIPVPTERRDGNGKSIRIRGASENNLQGIDVEVPLGKLVVVTGVSGSGKSSLIEDTLVRKVAQVLHNSRDRAGRHDAIDGIEHIDKLVDIDQSPIGRTPRSNPATYTGVFTAIRELFASVPESKARGYKAGRFSFNVKGGRCEECAGDGYRIVEMQFLPDVTVPCEACGGRRYNREALEIKFRDKSIADVLDMTVSEALEFFDRIPRIKRIIGTLDATGLGYIHLGQPATTLSGGEAQRIKLASELSKRSTGKTLYVLDEPTTGLSFQDVHHLLDVLHKLADAGNTVLVVEHHLDVIKTADHLIDLGPLGGDRGGELVATGTPEEVAAVVASYTGQYLRPLLERSGTVNGAKPKPTRARKSRKPANGATKPTSAFADRVDRETTPAPVPNGKPRKERKPRKETASERNLRETRSRSTRSKS